MLELMDQMGLAASEKSQPHRPRMKSSQLSNFKPMNFSFIVF